MLVKSVFLFFFLVIVWPLVYGQDSTLIDGDKVLKKIRESLPPSWSMHVERDTIVFERQGQVWSLFENQTSAPMRFETDDELAQRIKKYGVTTNTRLVCRFEPKWSREKRDVAQAVNMRIYEQEAGLMDTYNIAHLYDAMASAKGGEYFREGTPEENRRIAEYKKRKQELEEALIEIPEYAAEKYSLFFRGGIGYNEGFHLVYPFEASTEAYSVIDLIGDAASL